ncbi:hypothetical protein [Moorena producens]|uniref:hypothetical protein n=1 Tax=Moorena producens TaxID=1155739 RepID=UPI000ADD4FE1|nr:hypothetical protein [Moorena producens]
MQSLMGGTYKTALPSQDRNGAFDPLRIKFATGRTSASLLPAPCSLLPVPCSLLPVPCSLFPVPCSRLLQEVY